MDPECKIFTEEDESIKHNRLNMPVKNFVQTKETNSDKAVAKKNLRMGTISGDKAKESYLNIVGNDSLLSYNKTSKNTKYMNIAAQQGVSSKINSDRSFNMNANSVMKAVEANDVQKVMEFIQKHEGFVINVTDQYGWTAMMNACCAGAKDVVELLLQHYPNLDVADKKGNTCFSLARAKGHRHIIQLLEDHVNSSDDIFEVIDNENCKVTSESFYCDICKESVTKSIQSHLTSTVHLFNSSRKSGVPTSYGIPENNVGFQMLLKTGWDREKGLGPEGSGHKFPPKTMLKQDRAGLGAKTYVSRVTHDPSLVVKDRSERQQTLNKRERMRSAIRSKRKERELRRMLD